MSRFCTEFILSNKEYSSRELNINVRVITDCIDRLINNLTIFYFPIVVCHCGVSKGGSQWHCGVSEEVCCKVLCVVSEGGCTGHCLVWEKHFKYDTDFLTVSITFIFLILLI